MKRSWMPLVAITLAATACSGNPAPKKIANVANDKPASTVSKEEPPAPKEPPPGSAPARPFTAVPATWAELPNGLKIVSRRDKSVPIVHLRIGVLAGSFTDGAQTGLSSLCARAVGSSGTGTLGDAEVTAKLESLGASLKVEVAADEVIYGLSVMQARLSDAFDVLSRIVTQPRLKDEDIVRVQKRIAEEAADNARGDGEWGARMMLYRDLFELPSEHHPYASYDATTEDLNKLKPADCRNWHKQFFVPSNMVVAASGDIDATTLITVSAKHLGKLRKAAAPTISFTDPMPPAATKITLVDRPGSTQSDVFVGTLAMKREDLTYPSFVVADQVLGGAFTGRLSRDVREKRGLAYRTFSSIDSFANGPSVFYVYGQTQNASTADILTALLEHTQAMAREVPTAEEVATASSFVAGSKAIDSGMPGYTADMLLNSWVFKQSDDTLEEELMKGLRQATPDSIRKAFAEHVREGHAIVVVAGDAASVGPLLQSFGEVKVVDPTHNFNRVKTLPFTNPK